MTDREIKEHLDYLVYLASLEEPQGGLVGMKTQALSLIEPTINYLNKIERLPDEYQGQTLEDLLKKTSEATEPSAEEIPSRHNGVSRLIRWIIGSNK